MKNLENFNEVEQCPSSNLNFRANFELKFIFCFTMHLKMVKFHISNNTDTDFMECENTGSRYRVENIDITAFSKLIFALF